MGSIRYKDYFYHEDSWREKEREKSAALKTDIAELGLLPGSVSCMKRAGIGTLGQLIALTDDEAYEIAGHRMKRMDDLRGRLVERGYGFREEEGFAEVKGFDFPGVQIFPEPGVPEEEGTEFYRMIFRGLVFDYIRKNVVILHRISASPHSDYKVYLRELKVNGVLYEPLCLLGSTEDDELYHEYETKIIGGKVAYYGDIRTISYGIDVVDGKDQLVKRSPTVFTECDMRRFFFRTVRLGRYTKVATEEERFQELTVWEDEKAGLSVMLCGLHFNRIAKRLMLCFRADNRWEEIYNCSVTELYVNGCALYDRGVSFEAAGEECTYYEAELFDAGDRGEMYDRCNVRDYIYVSTLSFILEIGDVRGNTLYRSREIRVECDTRKLIFKAK